eukprot:649802-Amorphochlora_amoeboformis.AAC.1
MKNKAKSYALRWRILSEKLAHGWPESCSEHWPVNQPDAREPRPSNSEFSVRFKVLNIALGENSHANSGLGSGLGPWWHRCMTEIKVWMTTRSGWVRVRNWLAWERRRRLGDRVGLKQVERYGVKGGFGGLGITSFRFCEIFFRCERYH